MLAAGGTALAQYPWGYPSSPPGYYGGRQPPPVPERSGASLARAMLDAHNAVRARVGVPPLVWSPQLAAVAQQWADTLAATHRFAHSMNTRYGENLYAVTGGVASPAQVVGAWAEEARGFDIRNNACTGVCGHYTQIVWRATRAVGCAVARDPYRQMWVCDYEPPGNVVGYRPY